MYDGAFFLIPEGKYNGIDNNPLITVSGLTRYYHLGASEVHALEGVDLTVLRGEFLSIVGASGSGKSTLLNLIGGLDTATSGDIETPAGRLNEMTSKELAYYRAHSIGMIFQSFNLIPHRTALSNVELALMFNGTPYNERYEKSAAILTRLGLADRLHHRPDDLSGGEQQRVAVSRALVKNPEILLADEPTGNLDKENSTAIAEILSDWNRSGGTVIMVTHNIDLAYDYSGRVLKMDYGRIIESPESLKGV